MKFDLTGKGPHWKTSSMEDKVNDEDNFNGRQL